MIIALGSLVLPASLRTFAILHERKYNLIQPSDAADMKMRLICNVFLIIRMTNDSFFNVILLVNNKSNR
ncbi:hypothetical protein D3C76_1320560 [compost metagenome]